MFVMRMVKLENLYLKKKHVALYACDVFTLIGKN